MSWLNWPCLFDWLTEWINPIKISHGYRFHEIIRHNQNISSLQIWWDIVPQSQYLMVRISWDITPESKYLMVADFMRYYTRTTISHRTKGQKVKYTKYRKTVRWWAAGFMRYLPELWYLMIADYMTYNTGTTISFDCRFHVILH